MTWLLVVVNVLFFLHELSLEGALNGFLQTHGLVSARVMDPEVWRDFDWERQTGPLLTHMFLHGGWLHLIGNMWMLILFGDNVEGRLGHGNFLFFYIASGLGAAAAQVASDTGSFVPMVGASGAIGGVLGAYMVLFPFARVLTVIPILIFIQVVRVPAVVFIGFWALLQFFQGTAELHRGATAGVAFWAHLGGFGVGAVWILINPALRRGRARSTRRIASR